MLGPIIQNATKAVIDLVKSPSIQRQFIRFFGRWISRPENRDTIKEGFNDVVEFVQSIKIKVSYRTKEGDLIIEATEKAKISYSANNIYNSTVLQGNINMNKFSININITSINYNELQNINKRLKSITSMIDTSHKLKKELQKISEEVENLSSKQENILTQSTDYPLFQKALKTLNLEQ